jgi:hypothetical protein
MRVSYGKFSIEFIRSIILGDSLHNAGLVFFCLAPMFRVLVLVLVTAEKSSQFNDLEILQTGSNSGPHLTTLHGYNMFFSCDKAPGQ